MADEKAGNTQAVKPQKLLKSGVSPDVGKATQFKKGQSGNPAGMKPGYKHLSTQIQELLNDEKFVGWIKHPINGFEEVTGAPIKVIVGALIIRAMNGDTKAFDMLGKYGYGTKIDVTSGGERISETPKIISVIVPRDDYDAPAEA